MPCQERHTIGICRQTCGSRKRHLQIAKRNNEVTQHILTAHVLTATVTKPLHLVDHQQTGERCRCRKPSVVEHSLAIDLKRHCRLANVGVAQAFDDLQVADVREEANRRMRAVSSTAPLRVADAAPLISLPLLSEKAIASGVTVPCCSWFSGQFSVKTAAMQSPRLDLPVRYISD